MEIAREIEILGESDKSWDDAAQQALIKVARTEPNLRSLFIQNCELVSEDGTAPYCVKARIWISCEVE